MRQKRVEGLYDSFVAQFGEEIDDAQEFLEALVDEFPEASNEEIIDYVIESIEDNYDEVPHIGDAVADFSFVWGRKF